MRAAFIAYLIHQVTVERKTGDGVHANPTYSAASTHRARVEPEGRLVELADGRKLLIATRIFVHPISVNGAVTLTAIDIKDRVTIVHKGEQPRILAVEELNETTSAAIHHFEVLCG